LHANRSDQFKVMMLSCGSTSAALFGQEINGRINVQHEILGFNEGATIFAPKVKRFLA